MPPYFPKSSGAAARLGAGVTTQAMELIANRYTAENPPLPYRFHPFDKRGFMQHADGRYDLNLEDKLPEAKNGDYAYVYGMVWRASEEQMIISLNCYGPTVLYINGEQVFKSDIVQEVNQGISKAVEISLKPGWNGIWLCLRKAVTGFGCLFGSSESKWFPLDIMAPFKEREGWAGWVYSGPVPSGSPAADADIPGVEASELSAGFKWLPHREWTEEEAGLMQMERIFGSSTSSRAYAWTCVMSRIGAVECAARGRTAGGIRIWADEKLVYQQEAQGEFAFPLSLGAGRTGLVVEAEASAAGWGFTLELDDPELQSASPAADGSAAESIRFIPPFPAEGDPGNWYYMGPFNEAPEGLPEAVSRSDAFFGYEEEFLFWRADLPHTWLRPYASNPLYGKWNYPLGVTLYGLLQAGRLLSRKDITAYAVSHISTCVRFYEYALADKRFYGYPSLNNQLVEMNMLDDCGSFGSAMLEAVMENGEAEYRAVAGRIARYMSQEQERTAEGAFYRDRKGTFNENTMWADDLYMSTPFLVRYSRLSGNSEYLDDAARQFLHFKAHLYMPEERVMSHVYDFKYGMQTGIPWGRGNGWVLFSLSELLEALPLDHVNRPQLISFFRELCAGYAALQGVNGLWHQVLTHPDSYEEASCTAMFIYAIARGVRLGWLEEPAKYRSCALRGWDALLEACIDSGGNVHGVCRGSRYAFTPDYYKQELLWVTNDTHGIGIVLLAGAEVHKLTQMKA
jgi:unsaturated rhamnogalacturonyl hydrolase